MTHTSTSIEPQRPMMKHTLALLFVTLLLTMVGNAFADDAAVQQSSYVDAEDVSNRDNAGYGPDARMTASSVVAFIFTISKHSLVITGRKKK